MGDFASSGRRTLVSGR